jgi:glycosyltransferase involved in cell wall biosynthesis
MRILYISAVELDIEGGPKTHVIELIKSWHAQNHKILLLTPKFSIRRLRLPCRISHYPFAGYSFFRWMMTTSFLFATLIWHLYRFKPTVVYERQMVFNFMVSLACKIFRTPLFVEVNGSAEDLKQMGSNQLVIKVHEISEKFEFSFVTGVTCTSPLLKRKLRECHLNLADKTAFIPNGANLSLFRPMNKHDCRRRMGLEPHSRYIGYMGTFNHLHSPEQIIKSFRRVREMRENVILVMVGDGPLKKNCEKMVFDYSLNNDVIFTGSLKYEDVAIAINCFDIGLILASRLRLEREGVVAFKFQEFMACGCPIIAQYMDKSDEKRYSDFVKLVHIDKKSKIESAIIELLDLPEYRASIAEKAFLYAQKNLSWKKSAQLTVDFIYKML